MSSEEALGVESRAEFVYCPWRMVHGPWSMVHATCYMMRAQYGMRVTPGMRAPCVLRMPDKNHDVTLPLCEPHSLTHALQAHSWVQNRRVCYPAATDNLPATGALISPFLAIAARALALPPQGDISIRPLPRCRRRSKARAVPCTLEWRWTRHSCRRHPPRRPGATRRATPLPVLGPRDL